MNIGKLRRLIVIQQDNGSDTTGEWIPSWGTFATIRAEIIPEGGTEDYERDQLVAEARNRWKIRYLPGVTASMRIKDGSDYHMITSVEDYKEKRMMIIRTYLKDNE